MLDGCRSGEWPLPFGVFQQEIMIINNTLGPKMQKGNSAKHRFGVH